MPCSECREAPDDAHIHAAYREAVRRTHPDAGGSATAFEAVQEAYETLRDPAGRRAWSTPAPEPRARPATTTRAATASMEDLLAESERLEDEARRLAGMAPATAPATRRRKSLETAWRPSSATPERSSARWPTRAPANCAGASVASSDYPAVTLPEKVQPAKVPRDGARW